jgi:hypothetical protein
MSPEEFRHAVQSRAARIAVGASTVRGRGNKGVVASGRKFLRDIDLTPFGSDETSFQLALDVTTDELRNQLPKPAHTGARLGRSLTTFFGEDYSVRLARLRQTGVGLGC